MKTIFESAIRKADFDLTTILRRIEEYRILGRLSDMDCAELTALARASAKPAPDVTGEIQRLWAAVHALQAAGTENSGPDIPDFTQPTGMHDAYFAGDVIRYQGTTYTCIAPEGVACVWSPEVMPGYWQAA